MNNEEKLAKQALDKIIKKSRVHLYKPIQIAEILHRERVTKDITLLNLEDYRTSSKKWRDSVCEIFLGRVSTSSAKFQDDLFNENAVPPRILNTLGKINKKHNGVVEAYIYKMFKQKHLQMSSALDYSNKASTESFDLKTFLNLFWNEPGLRRSIDKIYEIVVYSLFSSLVDALEISIEIKLNDQKKDLLKEFEDFTKKVIQLSSSVTSLQLPAKIFRVGVTNAADRGLDMWANFGLAIQIKHLSLTEELAENIVSSVHADRIVIVCKDSEKNVIVSLLNQIGWKSKIQSIITESDLINWYERALRGKHSNEVGKAVLENIRTQIVLEFPSTDNPEITDFIEKRGYASLSNQDWVYFT
jgi:type II restriction enzyme